MKTEFEEKQYESAMNNELTSGSQKLYSPGQVLEYHLGFDVALHTHSRVFWKLARLGGVPKGPRGVSLYKYYQSLNCGLEHIPFKFNVFLQYKRPQYLNTQRLRFKV